MTSAGSGRTRKYWGGVSPFMGEQLVAAARRCEGQGLYGVLAGQNFGPPWIPLAAAAPVTQRLQLGASVAIAGVRSPVETAMAALDLDRISGGRFVLGLGTSTKWVTRDLFGAPDCHPLGYLRETVAAVRHIVHGAHRGLEPFRGRRFCSDFPGFPRQPSPAHRMRCARRSSALGRLPIPWCYHRRAGACRASARPSIRRASRRPFMERREIRHGGIQSGRG
jgi:alkanesulfonate monooxygenase SsuD/methylene tetrahydromethanopterin reductase-like flavin-dependent oxidoreductase (luciferase family)